MSLFLESIDNNMPDILKDGPHIPTSTIVIDPIVREGQPTIPSEVRTIVKNKADWVDEDRRLANLDVKARNFIVQAVPKDIYHSIKMCPTAKKMWETLTVMYEGSSTSMESTITTLTRKYERFFSLRNESLTDTHTRFNALVNDLITVGMFKSNDVLKSKFLDSLPPKWNTFISTVKLSPIYKELDLAGLFGLLRNQECSEAEKLIAMGDSYGQSSSALVASQTDQPSPKCKEIIPSPNVGISLDERNKSVCSDSDRDSSEDSDEGLANEVAMLAERIRRKSFGKFKARGKAAQADKVKKIFDMSKVTCYNCGKTGHMANDCRSKAPVQAEQTKNVRNDKYSKLKAKYKAMKAKVAKLSEKSLVAKDWVESDTSSEDELYEDAKCFMAKEATEKFQEDLAKLQQQSMSAQQASSSNSIRVEVHSFSSLSDSDKLAKLNRLGDEVLLQKNYNKEFKSQISALKSELSVKDNTIEKLQSDIKALKHLNATLLQEAKESDEKFLKLKHVTESWCTSAKRTTKCVNIQVPCQVQAVFDGDYDKAVAISEVCAIEPFYQPPPPVIVQTKGKKTKPIKIVDTSGVGFDEPEKPSLTIAESVIESEKPIVENPEDSLDLSKLTISQSESESKTVKKKSNKRKVFDLSSPRNNRKISRNEKVVSKIVSKAKSEPISKNVKPDTDSILAKLIESRLNNISCEVNLLKSLSESVDQGKVKNELKKNGIGKGEAKPETLAVARKNFKSGKGQTKQQWVSKSSKASGSLSGVTFGEPVLGWVPKKN